MTIDNAEIVFDLFLTLILYLIYWNVFLKTAGDLSRGGTRIFRVRLFGAVLFGIVSVGLFTVFTSYTAYSLGLVPEQGKALSEFLWALVLSLPVVGVSWLNAGNSDHLRKYPQIRASRWTGSMFAVNALTWILYITGYEILFRGVLLMPIAGTFGVAVAVAVSTVLYSAVHIAKSMKEAVGSLILGPVLCAITLYFGNIWAAVFVHITLVVSNTVFSFYRNSEMTFA